MSEMTTDAVPRETREKFGIEGPLRSEVIERVMGPSLGTVRADDFGTHEGGIVRPQKSAEQIVLERRAFLHRQAARATDAAWERNRG